MHDRSGNSRCKPDRWGVEGVVMDDFVDPLTQHRVDAGKRGLDGEPRALIWDCSGSEERATEGLGVDPRVDDVRARDP